MVAERGCKTTLIGVTDTERWVKGKAARAAAMASNFEALIATYSDIGGLSSPSQFQQFLRDVGNAVQLDMAPKLKELEEKNKSRKRRRTVY